METLWQDIRYGFRMLARKPGFTAVAVLTLALGIGANTAIFSVVNAVVLQPLSYPESNRLVQLWERNDAADLSYFAVSVPHYFAWKERAKTLNDMGAFREDGFNLTIESEAVRVEGARVTASLLPVLGVEPARGRNFLPEEEWSGDEHMVILTEGFWRRRFGADSNLLGQTIILDGAAHTVVGIMPTGFVFPVQEQVEVMILYGLNPSQAKEGEHFLRVVARLKPGVALDQARAEMATIADQLGRDSTGRYSGWTVQIESLYNSTVWQVQEPLLILLGAVALVLLIACVNVANLLLARSTTRNKEMAIRTALGAGRFRLIRQLLIESVLLAVVSGAAGLLLAWWGVDALLALLPSGLPRQGEIGMDAQVFGFAFAVSLLTGVLSGLGPALHRSRTDLQEALKEGGRTLASGGKFPIRSFLVVGELALALVLLVGAGLLVQTFLHLQKVEPGFNPTNTLAMEVTPLQSKYPGPEQRVLFFRELLDRCRALPGVESAAAVHVLPLAGGSANSLFIEGRPAPPRGKTPMVSIRAISDDYFNTLGVPLMSGRFLTEREAWGNPRSVIVNQAMARRYWPDEEPVGKRIGWNPKGPWLEIVGIVGDVKETGLAEEVQPAVYVPYLSASFPTMQLLVRTATDPLSLVDSIRRQAQLMDKNQAIAGFMTLEQFLSGVTAQPRFSALLFGLFAAVALLLAAVGIYGVVSFSVARRTHEIGIRMALGACPLDVLRLVVMQGMRLVLIGVVLGALGAYALGRVVSSLLFGVSPTDPGTFAAMALLLGVVALLACYLPARRATTVDPMVALRYE
jgi:putative ABC transport system permease protein